MELTLDQLKAAGEGLFPGLIGIEVDSLVDGVVEAHMLLRDELMAPNGFLHAAAVVGLADTACGYGCILRSAQQGTIACEARLVHGGRTTQIWDASVSAPDGRPMALFRCTQLVLR
jgi:1,4-dihydroxy-2-naphthoyl-CoA hydrolase